MTREMRIRDTLTRIFAPEALEVTDDSARHAGHAGAAPEGETHFNVRITSSQFAGMSRVARQRAINKALAEEFDTGLHALSIKADAA
ncbi:MAG: BolA family protein [Hyphomonadaceae bacterium]